MTEEIRILDVGHGNSAIALGAEWTVMIDAAPGETVVDAVKYLRLDRIDRVIISHRDADHAGGVVALLSRPSLEIGAIFIAADAAKDPSAPGTALLLAALDDAKRSRRCVVSRDLDEALPAGELDGGGLYVEVLAPSYATAMSGPRGRSPTGGAMTSNTVSAVIRVTLPSGLRVLLPGDIDHIALRELLERKTDLEANVLVFPHHGAHSAVPDEHAFAAEIMSAVRPQTVLFSIGRTERIRPSEQVMRGIFGVDSGVAIACTQLSRGCLPTDADLLADRSALPHLSGMPAAGAAGCRSCAGSMTLRAGGVAEPASDAHQAYIDAVASRPMCRAMRP